MAHSTIETIVGKALYVLSSDPEMTWDENALATYLMDEGIESPKARIITCIHSLAASGLIQGQFKRGKYEDICAGSHAPVFNVQGSSESTQAETSSNYSDDEELERLQNLVKTLLDERDKARNEADLAFNDLLDKQSELNRAKEEIAAKEKEIEDIQSRQSGILAVHVTKGRSRKPRIIEELFHKEFPILIDLAKARKNIFIYGPTGCGKSHVGKQVANVLELDFKFISCTAGMSEGNVGGRSLPTQPDKDELIATYRGLMKSKIDKQAAATLAAALTTGFSYVISEFVHCYEHGGVFLLDEIDAADSNVLLFINAALANGKAAVPNRPNNPYATRHDDFVCMAAANTAGTGGDRMFTGRAKLDGATLDRFQVGKIEFDYDRDLERQLCVDAEGNTYDELSQLCWDVREAIDSHRLERAMSTRFMIDAAEMKRDFNWSNSILMKRYFTGWRKDEVNKVVQSTMLDTRYGIVL